MSWKKRIVIVPGYSLESLGGGERWALELAAAIQDYEAVTIVNPRSKHDTKRISLSKLLSRYRLKTVNIVDLDCFGIGGLSKIKEAAFGTGEFVLKIPNPFLSSDFVKSIKNSDVVYILSTNPLVLAYALVVAKRYGKKIIYGVHNPLFSERFSDSASPLQKLFNSYFSAFVNLVDEFHVLNRQDFELVRSNFPKIKVRLIPNFIKIDEEKPQVNEKEFVVLFAGRLQQSQKGVDLLPEIIRGALNCSNAIKFHIIGSSDDGEKTVKELSDKYTGNVKWLGFVSDRKLKAEQRNASLFIFPSRYESFGLALLEAQGRGLPAVAFKVQGPEEIIASETQGRLVKPFDTKSFSKSILAYYQKWSKNKKAYLDLKLSIKEIIKTRYGIKKVIPKLVKMLEE